MKKLAIVTSHPIQYNAPLFRLLSERNKIEIKVFYTWGQTKEGFVYDPDFKKTFRWDIPLLEGYNHEFIENLSKNPGAGSFNGIINRDLIERINEFNPDAILIYGWSFRSHLQCIRYFHKKVPVFFRGDSTLLDESRNWMKAFVKTFFLKWIYSHIDKALYVGQNNKDYFKKFGLSDNQLVFAPHAVENARFQDVQKINFRQQLGISGTDIVFLFAGKLESKKNPFLLMESFCKIENPNTHLVFVGNGKLENQLKATCLTLHENIQTRIKFLDFQNQSAMPDIYKMADVFVLASKGPGETWGLSVNEAMASGVAALVSNKCGCASDLVIDGVTGYTFNSDDSTALVSKMNLFLDKSFSHKMGLKAKNLIADWSFENIANKIETLLN